MEDKAQVTTTILLDGRTWRLLHELARLRAECIGGRPSKSGVLRELVIKESKKGKGDARA